MLDAAKRKFFAYSPQLKLYKQFEISSAHAFDLTEDGRNFLVNWNVYAEKAI